MLRAEGCRLGFAGASFAMMGWGFEKDEGKREELLKMKKVEVEGWINYVVVMLLGISLVALVPGQLCPHAEVPIF